MNANTPSYPIPRLMDTPSKLVYKGIYVYTAQVKRLKPGLKLLTVDCTSDVKDSEHEAAKKA